eukprot:scaffold43441_cov197-Isochrysis_galbana.AAC.1
MACTAVSSRCPSTPHPTTSPAPIASRDASCPKPTGAAPPRPPPSARLRLGISVAPERRRSNRWPRTGWPRVAPCTRSAG